MASHIPKTEQEVGKGNAYLTVEGNIDATGVNVTQYLWSELIHFFLNIILMS